MLTSLHCSNNQLTSLDVSQNIALNSLVCDRNQLTSLDVSANTALTILDCWSNQLTDLDVSNNNTLIKLHCYDNEFISLDVSANTALNWVNCSSNWQLTSLNVKNGNNSNFSIFNTHNSPNLTCINVDDSAWSTINWTVIDSQHYFSDNCPPPLAIQEHTTHKKLLKVTDLLGRETKGTKNEVLFYLYDDGTVEKRIVIE